MSDRPPVVSNASPLIALNHIERLALLELLFGDVLVPPAVTAECQSIVAFPDWVRERPLGQPIGPRLLKLTLGLGESEAISLAIERNAQRVLLDERRARQSARALGLRPLGTLGILLAAKRRGHLSEIRPCLSQLAEHGFRVSPQLRAEVLLSAGELP